LLVHTALMVANC